MDQKIKNDIVQYIPICCASHTPIYDKEGILIDFLIVDGNDSLKKLLENGSGTPVHLSEIFTIITDGSFDWLHFYRSMSLLQPKQSAEFYSAAGDKWIKIEASMPGAGCFTTVLTDITEVKNEAGYHSSMFAGLWDTLLELSEDYIVLKAYNETALPLFSSFPIHHSALKDIMPDSAFLTLKKSLEAAAHTQQKQTVETSVSIQGETFWYRLKTHSQRRSEDITFICGIEDITKEKKEERELYFFTEDYEKVFNVTKDSMFIVAVHPGNRFVYLRNNIAHQTSTGITEEFIAGKTPQELLGEENAAPVLNHYLTCAEAKESIEYEEVIDFPTGKSTWLTTLTPIIFNDVVTHLIGSAHNITPFRETQRELEESKQRLENVIYATNAGTWEWDIEKSTIQVNELWAEMIGYTRKELHPLSLSTWKSKVHPEDLPRAMAAIDAVLANETAYYDEQLRLIHKDGHTVWVHDRGKVTSWSIGGTPLVMSGTFGDISKQMETQEKLQQSEQLMTLVMNTVPLRIYWKNRNLQFLGCNTKFALDAGFEDSADIVNKKDAQIDWAKESPEFSLKDQEIMRRELSIVNQEEEVTLPDGTVKWLRTSKAPLYSHRGVILGMMGTYEDITKQKNDENELSYSLSLIRAAMDATGDGMLVVDRQGLVVDWNSKWLQMWNLPSKDLQGSCSGDIIQPLLTLLNEPAAFAELFHKLNTTSIETVIETYYLQDGRIIQIHAQPQTIAHKTVGRVWNFRDITSKQKQMDEIWRLSYRDQLTKVYNRRFYEEKLHEFEQKEITPVSLIVVDVNGLKLANDAFGHEIGDKMLSTVAEILVQNSRSSDYVCRIGGDEFVVLLPGCKKEAAAETVRLIHKDIKEASFTPVVLSVSLGANTRSSLSKSMIQTFQHAEDRMYASKLSESINMRTETIQMIQQQLFKQYPMEKNHAENVRKWSLKIGRKMNLQHHQLEELAEAAYQHDIGKISANVNLLSPNKSFSEKESLEIKKHPETGYQILRASPSLVAVSEVVLAHHERWDGTGYPKGLKQKDIPLLSRIIAAAETFDALTSGMQHGTRISHEEAINILANESGKQFDPAVVEAFQLIFIQE